MRFLALFFLVLPLVGNAQTETVKIKMGYGYFSCLEDGGGCKINVVQLPTVQSIEIKKIINGEVGAIGFNIGPRFYGGIKVEKQNGTYIVTPSAGDPSQYSTNFQSITLANVTGLNHIELHGTAVYPADGGMILPYLVLGAENDPTPGPQ